MISGSPDKIAAAFGLKSSAPGTHKTRCPAHDDRNPSLSITIAHDKALITCHAGCSTDAVLQAVGLTTADMFFDEPKQARREVTRYEYQGYTKVRYEPKSFAFFDAAGNPGLNGTEHVLYHLPDIATAKAEGVAIFVTEGEQDADTIREKLQCVAVSLDCGALPVNASQARLKPLDALQGATVYILPDQDEPGKIHGETVAKYLQGKAREVYIVNVPDGKDVTEYFEQGGTTDAFRQLCAAAEMYKPNGNNTGWTLENTRPDWILQEPAPFEFIIPGLLAKRLVGFIYGSGGTYKSLAALWLVLQRGTAQINNGQKWFDRFPVPFGRSIFFSAEDVLLDLHHRIHNINPHLVGERVDISLSAVQSEIMINCRFIPREMWVEDGTLFLFDENGPTNKVAKIIDLVNSFGADLVILETCSRIFPLDENDNTAGARLVGVLEYIRDKTGATILVVDHSSKTNRSGKTDLQGQNSLRGAGSKLDNARFGLLIEAQKRENGADVLKITNSKTFRTQRADSFKVRVDFPRFSLMKDSDVGLTVFDNVIEFVREHPGTSTREIRKGVIGKTTAISQAIRDGKEEGILIFKKGKGFNVQD